MGKKQAKKKKAEARVDANNLKNHDSTIPFVPSEGQDEEPATRHEESDLDDDDVPSELLPVNWRNPQLDVETEIVVPVNIVLLDPSKAENPVPASETFFETPFDPCSNELLQEETTLDSATSPAANKTTSSPRREPLEYISAWDLGRDHDDEDEPIPHPPPSSTAADQVVVLPIEQWVTDALKGLPLRPLPLCSEPTPQRSLPSWTRPSPCWPVRGSARWLISVMERTSLGSRVSSKLD
jgi:hypothetical protein